MAARLSPPRVGILRAMLSREAPLVLWHRQWFVRDWGAAVSTRDVAALIDTGMVESPKYRGRLRLLVLTEAGRDLATQAAARAHPPTLAEDIAA